MSQEISEQTARADEHIGSVPVERGNASSLDRDWNGLDQILNDLFRLFKTTMPQPL